MILRGHAGLREASVELEVSELGPSSTPADRDLLLNVTVAIGGYRAADQVWIVDAGFDRFLTELSELERTRRGRAALEAASPEDFRLSIEVVDAAGHIAIRGQVSDRTPDGFRLSLSFGFTFDPGQLASSL
jgi:hypothetical protein